MKLTRLISHPLVLLGLGAAGLGGLLVVKSLVSVPRERGAQARARRNTGDQDGGKTVGEQPDGRDWVVLYSGHGSAFRYDGSDPHSPPPPPHKTFEEARQDAIHWELHADTIGGQAQLKNVRTGEIVSRF